MGNLALKARFKAFSLSFLVDFESNYPLAET